MTSNNKIEELLTRGVEEVINKKHLETALKSKKKLRVKLGIDPTSPNIHIGRAVVLWKLRAFQELGHKVIFIVGDFTGLIGDTSDKDAERKMMPEKEIKNNIKNYFAQAYKILDRKSSETYYNSTWLKKLNFKQVGELADLFGLHEFEARENIANRLKQGKRVSVRELLYPLMQGYDSVVVKADVELGGTDQKFNLLAGRKIQKAFGQNQQDILTMNLLEGTDGRKMSSSWGNVINITDTADDMFGKVMSIGDSFIKKYFLLATQTPLSEIDRIMSELKNPRDQKLILAQTLTSQYHGMENAAEAKENFIRQFSEKKLPVAIPLKNLRPGNYQLTELLVATGLVASKTEARRLINQKGIKVDQRIINEDRVLRLNGDVEILLQAGKRRFVRVK